MEPAAPNHLRFYSDGVGKLHQLIQDPDETRREQLLSIAQPYLLRELNNFYAAEASHDELLASTRFWIEVGRRRVGGGVEVVRSHEEEGQIPAIASFLPPPVRSQLLSKVEIRPAQPSPMPNSNLPSQPSMNVGSQPLLVQNNRGVEVPDIAMSGFEVPEVEDSDIELTGHSVVTVEPQPRSALAARARGRPRKNPKLNGIKRFLHVGVDADNQNIYERIEDLSLDTQQVLVDNLRAAYVKKGITYINIINMRENSSQKNQCLNMRLYNCRLRLLPEEATHACSFCSRMNRLCTRIISMDDKYVMCIYPRSQPGHEWNEVGFWLIE